MLLYWYDSRLGCRDFRVNMFSENKSINQKCFQNVARWSRGMILAYGARGPGFKSRTSPLNYLGKGTWLVKRAPFQIPDESITQCDLKGKFP